MPYPNIHTARVINPSEFESDSFRTKEIADGVQVILGKLKGKDSMVAQSYHFKADKFTADEAKSWLKKNNITTVEFTEATGSDGSGSPVKYGNRNNANDQQVLNTLHAMTKQMQSHLESLGAVSGEAIASAPDWQPHDEMKDWMDEWTTVKGN